MGYDIHITRKLNWFDREGPAISLDEWRGLIKADAEMRLDGYAQAELTDGGTFRVEGAGLAVWTGYSRAGTAGNAWFDLRNGNVVVNNADAEIRRKMYAFAQRLSAKVQGDDGEFYDPRGDEINAL